MPALVAGLGDAAAWRYVECFTANIRNPNTRRAYARACGRFFGWCEQHGLPLAGTRPFNVAVYVEELQREGTAPSVKQQLAAIRMLCDWLVTGQVMPSNPASSVRGPRHVVKTGRTPVLEGVEWRRLMDTIPEDSVGSPQFLRDSRIQLSAPTGRWCMGAWGNVVRLVRLRRVHSVQPQRSTPPPYPQAALAGDQLASLRGGPAAAWRPHRLAGGGCAVRLECTASDDTWRSAALLRCSDRAGADAAAGLSSGAASGRGFARSVLRLLGLDLSVPDHATFSRRGRAFAGRQPRIVQHDGPVHVVLDSTGLQMFGQGEWDAAKHGRTPRQWRKLHLAADAETSEILAHVLTDPDVGDITAVPSLLATVEGPIASVIADGAYDGASVYKATFLRQRDPPLAIVIPPRASSMASTNDTNTSTTRNRHVQDIAESGRMAWKKDTGYGRRSLVETAIGRYKRGIGPKLRARLIVASRAKLPSPSAPLIA